MNEPKRRGRPPANPEFVDAVGEVAAPIKRRRRPSVGGHEMRLDAPQRDGYIRRWFNDDGNRIAKADDLAYDFVLDTSIKGTGEGSRVSRLVGTKANGEPLRAYLMETPVEEYQAGLAEKEAETRQFDAAINRGEDPNSQTGPSSDQYGSGSITRDA